ncbi:hypothetical protein KM043_017551 [Ampulex compressa]|nr:hypothetical protein KM043_017551 [Ampulex compressa]
MALVYIEDTDPWLIEYDACEKLFREIMEQLTARNAEARNSQAYANLSANVRIRLKQYSREVQQLRIKIQDALKLKTITGEEAERRMRQIELLESKDVQLQRLYDCRTNDLTSSWVGSLRTDKAVFADTGTTSWAIDEDNDSDTKTIDHNMSVNDLVFHQERVLQEQDKGLEELCKVIARQKEISQSISNEVEYQHEIIDDLADHMERTDESLIKKTHQVQIIQSQDRTYGYWIIIIIFFISIVVIALV